MRRIDWRNPISDHEDNAGLVFALLNLPGQTGGSRWPDSTGRTNGGTLVNAPEWEANGLSFSVASGQSVTCGDILDAATQLSLGATVRLSAYPSGGSPTFLGVIYSKEVGFSAGNGGYTFAVTSDGKLFIRIRNSANTSVIANGATTLDLNRTYRVWTTYDGVNLRLYLDGVPDGSTSTSLTIGNTSLSLTIGNTGGNDSRLSGSLRNLIASNVRGMDANWVARDYERSLRPASENPTLRRLSGTLYGSLSAATPTSTRRKNHAAATPGVGV
jgi:hypothetical protein